MSDIANDSTIAYNGFTFPVETETVSLEGKPVYDSAQRQVIYVLWSLTLRAIISSAANDTANSMTTIRKKLTAAGGLLTYSDTGFGAFAINNKAVKDVIWGPRPQMLSWKPIGHRASCEIVWKVEVAIPECDAPKYQNALMEFCYRASYAIDQSGYTKRTLAGYIRIPQTRNNVNLRTLNDNADEYRKLIHPPLLKGFKRLSSDYSTDESKCRLNFSIVDEEMAPNMYPEGVVECRASHTLETTETGFFSWVGTLQADYEIAKDHPKALAIVHFRRLWKDRLLNTQKTAGRLPKASLSVLPFHLTMSEPEIYGRKCAAFTLRYRYTTTVGTFMRSSSLWRPVPENLGGGWQRWSASLALVHGARGLANIGFSTDNDIIVDLCANAAIKLGGPGADEHPGVFKAAEELLAELFDDDPNPEASWIAFQCDVNLQVLDEVAELKPLPMQRIVQRPDAGPEVRNMARIQHAAKVGYDKLARDAILQKRAMPTIAVTLTGNALRAGYAITPPVLKNVSGIIPVACNQTNRNGFVSGIVANYGVPIVAARWSLRYLLPNVPAQELETPTNILDGEL